MINLVLLDDQQIFIDSLSMALSLDERFHVIAATTSSEQLLDLLGKEPVDLLLMDIAMPERSGLSVYDELRKRHSKLKVIAMSGLLQYEAFVALWDQNINGLVHKSDDLERLQEAIVAVVAGQRFLSPSLRDKIKSTESESAYKLLTKREKQILHCITEGLSNKQIAEDLGISLATVRTHRENLMTKIFAHSTADIMRFAFKQGLVADMQPGV